ncbi:hypothetical protein GIB67_019139 [Kingdonia uniflora]|uniref:FAS1 domain-containing protein n=1 Tax=Kingdonia uniflora TaxID=39325 RepID=A0A7J7N022_9MAGN|nr:hypothetical protein GIB67_019139 [Kingdonia uniflora]
MAGALAFSLLYLTLTLSLVSSHNITQILDLNPDYSLYNKYLTDTKLNDEIDSRTTITLLVLNNGAMSALASKNPLSVIKNVLSLLVLLDYYDPSKLHDISKGTTLTTTLYQTTGNAPGNLGFVNITDLKGGKVGFGSAAPGSKLDSSYTKSVKQIPYNISVIEITGPIIAPGILTPTTNANITALLEKAGCKTFVSLIVSSGVLKVYESAAEKGLTLFAPSDEAFKKTDVPDLTKLSNAETVTLLTYHALAGYTPKGTLKTTKGPISTLATNGAGKYELTVKASGDSVALDTGVDSSRVSGTVIDSTPLVIFTVDDLLLPPELFGKSPSPAPSMEPVEAPGPSPVSELAPTPEIASAPGPALSFPPAPPTSSPEGTPAEAPATDAADVKSPGSAAVDVRVPVKTLVAVVVIGLMIIRW